MLVSALGALAAFERRGGARGRPRVFRSGDSPDPFARALAAADAEGSLQSRFRQRGRDRVGSRALSRSAAVGQRSPLLRELPSSGEELHRRPAEGAGTGRRSTATRRASRTCACSAGTAGMARATACGRRACGRWSIRARWAAMSRAWRPPCAATPISRAATAGRSARRRRPTTRRSPSMSPRRSRPSRRRSRRDARRSTTSAMRSRAATATPRRAIRSRRSADSRSSSARDSAMSAISAPAFPTASSTMSAFRTSSRAGAWTPAGTKASRSSGRAATTCSGRTTTTRRAARQ